MPGVLNTVTISEVTEQFVLDIINDYQGYDNYGGPRGLYWHKAGERYVGCDHSAGHCWVEEFDTYAACILWLLGVEEEE